MKKKAIVLSAFLALLLSTGQAFAAVTSKTFSLQANIPAATGSNITAASVNATTGVFTALAPTVTTLSFNTGASVPFNVPNGIYAPNQFFAIDITGSGGAGNPDVTFTYSGDVKPAGQLSGLGVKATATFVKVTGATGAQTETVLANGKKRLIDLTGESVLKTAYSGGFLRVYLGIVTKDPTATPLDPANSEPFTNADQPGAYSGTLLVSATVP